MRGHVVVDRVGEDAVVTVEEEDDDEGEGGHRRELEDGAELGGVRQWLASGVGREGSLFFAP